MPKPLLEQLSDFLAGRADPETRRRIGAELRDPNSSVRRLLDDVRTAASSAMEGLASDSGARAARRVEIAKLSKEAESLHAQGQYSDAARVGKEACELARLHLGEASPAHAAALTNYGNALRALASYAEAKSAHEQALAISEAVLGPIHKQTGTILNNLGYTLASLGLFVEAETRYREALEVRRAACGAEHPDVAQTLNNLALLLQKVGNYPVARSHYEEAIRIRQQAVDSSTGAQRAGMEVELATSLNNLASLCYDEGEYQEAERLYRQAMTIDQRVLGEDHPSFAIDLNNLALVLKAMGNLADAEPLYRRALELKHKTLPEGHPSVATALNNLAALYEAMADFDTAERLHREELAILQKALGETHVETARSLNNLAAVLRKKGDSPGAEALYRASLEIRRNKWGEEHPAVAQSLNNLAQVFRERGADADAQQYSERALAIYKNVFGANHPETARSLNNLAFLYQSKGDYAAAEPLYHEALAVEQNMLGKMHPSVARTLQNLAAVHAATGRHEEAANLMQAAVAIVDDTIRQVFAIGSEKQRQTFLESVRGQLNLYLSLVLRHFAAEPRWVRAAFDLVLRRKGLEAEPQAAAWDARLAQKYPALGAKFQKLTELRKQIAVKRLSQPQPAAAEAYRDLLAGWEAEESELETELATHVPEILQARRFRTATRWVVASRLSLDSALAEFVRFDLFDFTAVPARREATRKQAHYAAFVLRAGDADDVSMVDLGDAVVLDRLISEYRAEAAIERTGRRSAYLRAIAFDRVASVLSERKHLVIAPDGELSRLEFEHLQTDDGRQLGTEFRLGYVATGRELLKATA